ALKAEVLPLGSQASDIFLLQLSSDGHSLLYSTFLGSTGNETGSAVALDGNGGVYVAGTTQSLNYPTTPGAFRTQNPKGPATGGQPGVVSKIHISSPVWCNPNISPSPV